MVEFVQQNNPGPSAFHDLYPEGSGRFGLHHVALIVERLADVVRHYESAGFATALHGTMNDGFEFVMIDTVAKYGHMIELYEGADSLVGFYDFVRKAALGFDGTDPIRQINLS